MSTDGLTRAVTGGRPPGRHDGCPAGRAAVWRPPGRSQPGGPGTGGVSPAAKTSPHRVLSETGRVLAHTRYSPYVLHTSRSIGSCSWVGATAKKRSVDDGSATTTRYRGTALRAGCGQPTPGLPAGLARRDFLRYAAAGATMLGVGSALAGCGGSSTAASPGGSAIGPAQARGHAHPRRAGRRERRQPGRAQPAHQC